jgi:hypothetical protein
MESMEALIKFLRNQFRDGFFNGKLLNPRDVSEPIADAIKYGAELNAKIVESSFGKMSEDEGAISKEIKKELKDGVDRIVKAKLAKESVDFLNKLEFVKGEQGEPGEDGHTPTKEELIPIIKPLIPEPIPGKPGKDYILTVKDKKEIAKSIKVPVVEKVVETIIKEQPIVTNEIVEKAVSDKPEEIVNKLQSLDGDNRLDASAIKGLEKISTEGRKMYGKAVKYLSNLLDVSIASPTNNQVLKYNSTTGKWENGTVSGGSGTPGGSDTEIQYNDGGAFGGIPTLTYDKVGDSLLCAASGSASVYGGTSAALGIGSDDTRIEFTGSTVDFYVDTDNAFNLVEYNAGKKAIVSVASIASTDKTFTLPNNSGTFALLEAGQTFTADILVPDEAYDASGWNGSFEVPTKNAIRDKIESMSASGGITRTIVSTSGSATMGSSASTDYVYFVTGAHTMSLPAAAGNTNRYTVKNNHSANITIDTAGAETVEGAASISIAPEESVDFLSNGTNWSVI